jgi:hypothetical protein
MITASVSGSVAEAATVATWTTVVPSANPAAFGQSVTFTATVKAVGGGAPTGSVTFKDGAGTLGTTTLNGLGQTTFVASSLAIGTHPVTAVYAGDSNFAGSTSSVVSQATPQSTNCAVPGFFHGSPVNFLTGTFRPTHVAVLDLNLDGNLDLVGVSDRVTTVLGDGRGGFVHHQNVGSGIFGNPPAVGDFNLDGKPDVTVSGRVFLGNGAGALGSPAPSGLWLVATTDFNMDGKPDLAGSKNDAPDKVGTILGDGSGDFGSVTSEVGVGSAISAIAAADFNLDGKPDVAVATAGTNRVSVLLGDGLGGFALTGSPVSVGSSPSSVVVADFNSDGKPDLAVANLQSDNVTILLGDGSGGLSEAAGSPVSVGSGASGMVEAADFNLDGKADLVLGGLNSRSVATLLGNGSGGFSAVTFTQVPAATDTRFVARGDLNQDGKVDLVLPQGTSVLIGNCDAAATSVVLSSSANPSRLGQSVTLIATVSGAPGTPTGGRFSFEEGLVLLGSGALNGGVASLTTSSLSEGAHSITARYFGDASFAASSSSPLTQGVGAGLTVDAGSVSEGHTGITLLAFNVRLTNPFSSTVTVSYSTANGTAVAGTDFTAKAGTLTFLPGRTLQTVLVPVIGNTSIEPDKSLFINLSQSSGATILTAQATGTIINDDPVAPANLVAQYRLYHPITREHLYTTDANEYAVLGGRFWTQEGIAYTMPRDGGSFGGAFGQPLYRLYHAGIQQHHWTMDTNEATVLSSGGWIYEGISGYLLPTQASGSVPLYRLNLVSPPQHLWTTDENEKTVLSTQRGWIYEGIVGYVIP